MLKLHINEDVAYFCKTNLKHYSLKFKQCQYSPPFWHVHREMAKQA